MILVISMAQADAYDRNDGGTGLKRKFEKLTGAPVISIHHREATPEYVARINPQAIFITGFGHSWGTVPVQDLLGVSDLLHTTDIPVYGACGGHQLIGFCFNRNLREVQQLQDEPMRKLRPGEPDPGPVEYNPGYYVARGFFDVQALHDDPIFAGLGKTFRVLEAHYCEVKTLPPDFLHLARNANCELQCIRHKAKPLYGAQFHAETWTEYYPDGKQFIANFFHLAGLV